METSRAIAVLAVGWAACLASCRATPEAAPETTEEPSLEGPVWQLASLGDDAEPALVADGTRITAEFMPQDRQVAGSAGCNHYSASYELGEEGSITIGPSMMTTLMSCGPVVDEQEQAFLEAFSSAESYSIRAGTLEILCGSGKALRFRILRPTSLEAAEWEVVRYHNGRDAVTSIITGTEITARFSDRQVSGSSGCNTYTASYEVDGDTITIGPAATTRRYCAEPEGTMEQEDQFLAALESAHRFSIEGEVLDMHTADGARALTMRAKVP